MHKFILSFLFLASSLNAMDYGLNSNLEEQVFSKSLLVVNAQNLVKEAERNLQDTQKVTNLSYLSAKWDEAGQAVKEFLENIGCIQKVILGMVSLAVQGNSNVLSTSNLQLLDSEYQASVMNIMKIANEMPGVQVLSIANLKGDKVEGNLVLNPLNSIVSQLIGTNLQTRENAANAVNSLNLVIEQIASAQQEQNNNLKTIKMEKEKNLKTWESQIQQLLKGIEDLSSNLTTTTYILTQNLK